MTAECCDTSCSCRDHERAMRAALFEAVRAIESEARLSWSRWRLAQKFRRLAEKEQG